MSGEFYSEEDVNKTESEEQESYSGGTFHYSYDGDSAKWEPDSEKYNTPAPEPSQPKRKRSLWWIPVAVIMTVIVLAVIFGSIIGFRILKKEVQGKIPSSSVSTEEITIAAPENIAESGDSGLVINDAETVVSAGSPVSGIYITDVSDVVDRVMPAVVSITSRTLISNGNYGGFFYYYFGNQNNNENNSSREVESGIGSGTIVGQNEKELLILTSYHVVEGSSSLYVTFCDDSAVDGYIKAASEEDDIAIVAIALDDIDESTMEQIRVAAMADEAPSVGDGAIVIGNALGYGQSVVTGIVSALDREITVEGKTITVIQTDAAINQGNSGGCLLNANGDIIGISEAKINSTVVEGMCYAISLNHYYDKIIELLEMAPAEKTDTDNEQLAPSASAQGAYLGIYGYDIDSQLADSYELPEGVYVLSTVKGGGAEAAGIKEGDVIVGLDGKDITSMSALQNALADYDPGDEVSVTVMRSKNNSYEEIELKVKLTAAIG